MFPNHTLQIPRVDLKKLHQVKNKQQQDRAQFLVLNKVPAHVQSHVSSIPERAEIPLSLNLFLKTSSIMLHFRPAQSSIVLPILDDWKDAESVSIGGKRLHLLNYNEHTKELGEFSSSSSSSFIYGRLQFFINELQEQIEWPYLDSSLFFNMQNTAQYFYSFFTQRAKNPLPSSSSSSSLKHPSTYLAPLSFHSSSFILGQLKAALGIRSFKRPPCVYYVMEAQWLNQFLPLFNQQKKRENDAKHAKTKSEKDKEKEKEKEANKDKSEDMEWEFSKANDNEDQDDKEKYKRQQKECKRSLSHLFTLSFDFARIFERGNPDGLMFPTDAQFAQSCNENRNQILNSLPTKEIKELKEIKEIKEITAVNSSVMLPIIGWFALNNAQNSLMKPFFESHDAPFVYPQYLIFLN